MNVLLDDFNKKRKTQAFRESTANSVFSLLDELYGGETPDTTALKGTNPYAFTVPSGNLLRLLSEASTRSGYQESHYKIFTRKEILETSFAKLISLNSPLWREQEGLSMKGLSVAGNRTLDFFQLERAYRELLNSLESVEEKGSPNLLEKMLVEKISYIFEEIEETYSKKTDSNPEPDSFIPHFGLILMFLSESLESSDTLPKWAGNKVGLLFTRSALTELSLIEPSEMRGFQESLEKLAKDAGLLDFNEEKIDEISGEAIQVPIDKAVKDSLELFEEYSNLETGKEGSSLRDFLRILLTEYPENNSPYLEPYRGDGSYMFLPNSADKEKYSVLSRHNLNQKLLEEGPGLDARDEGAPALNMSAKGSNTVPAPSNPAPFIPKVTPGMLGNTWTPGPKVTVTGGSSGGGHSAGQGQPGIYVYSHVYTGLMIALCELHENLVELSKMETGRYVMGSYLITLRGMRSIYRNLRMIVRTLDPITEEISKESTGA